MGLYSGAAGECVVGANAFDDTDAGSGAEKVNVPAGGDAWLC